MKGLLALSAFLAIILVLGPACTGLTTTYDVKYELSGTASTVDITYTNEDGGTSQLSDVPLPWTLTFKRGSGQFVYVSGQNQAETGSVVATVYKDGKVFKTSTSEGAYVIATASGML